MLILVVADLSLAILVKAYINGGCARVGRWRADVRADSCAGTLIR